MDRSKWEYKKLGEVCEILDKLRKPVTKSDRVAGQYPYYGATGIQDYVANYIFDGRYLLLGEDGAKWGANDRSAFIIEGKTWVNNHAHILKINSDYMDVFVMYYLNHKDLSEYITGAVVPKLTQAAMAKIPVPYINIADQQRIVAELDCLNEMIALKQEQLKEFDKLAQSIFYDMFGDSDGYEKVKLGDVVEVVSGLVDPNTEPYCSQLHVSPANIVGGTNEIVNCVQAKSEGLISDKYPFKAGMILYSKIRPNLNKVAIARFDGICSADMYPLSVLPKANNVYITKLLSSKQFLDYAIKNSGRARMPKLNRETLFSYSFNLPPLALQQQFAEKIQAIEAQKELVKKSIVETQQLLDSRMDYYFN